MPFPLSDGTGQRCTVSFPLEECHDFILHEPFKDWEQDLTATVPVKMTSGHQTFWQTCGIRTSEWSKDELPRLVPTLGRKLAIWTYHVFETGNEIRSLPETFQVWNGSFNY